MNKSSTLVPVLLVFVAVTLHGCTSFMRSEDSLQQEKDVAMVKQSGLKPMKLTDKPSGDPRTFQYTVLPNGVQVVNVHDAKAVHAAFATSIKAGSMDNPENLPGLAHFCEHMLFLGTEAYPEPTGWDDFVSRNGGKNNAYTSDEVTVYFAEISKGAMDEGLKRFADFFRAPLFNDTFVEKEVHAIDSEHAKNVQDPSRRVYEVMKGLANPASPVGRFKTGDVSTLFEAPAKEGTNAVDELKSWFQDHYCPSRMHLVTVGPQSLEHQLNAASEQYGNLPQGSEACQGPRKSWASPEPWPAERMGKWVVVHGTEPQAKLWLQFSLPDISKAYLSNPERYLRYMLTYSGEQSLSRVLSDTLGLVSAFSFSTNTQSSGTDAIFHITLTSLGRKHPKSVIDLIFQYLGTLRSNGVDKELYSTLIDITRLEWDWQGATDPMSTVEYLAGLMTRYPPELLLAESRVDKTDPALATELLEKLRPDNMNAIFVDPDAKQTLFGKNTVSTLAHYDVKYTVVELGEQFKGGPERWASFLEDATPPPADSSFVGIRKRYVPELVAEELQLAGIKYTASPVPISPKPIVGVPKTKELNLLHMHAHVEKASEPILAMFGAAPAPLADATKDAVPTSPTSWMVPSLNPTNIFHSHHGWGARHGDAILTNHSASTDPQLWYRSGWVTDSPKAKMKFVLTPLQDESELERDPAYNLRLSIFNSLLSEELEPKMVDQEMTGVSYGLSMSPSGLAISFAGFTPTMPALIDSVLLAFDRGVNVSENLPRYDRIVERLNQSLHSYSEMPVQYALSDRNMLLSTGSNSKEDSIAALQKITPESVESSLSELIFARPLQLSGLAMGNIPQQDATAALGKVLERADTWPGSSVEPSEGQKKILVTPVVNPASPIELRKLNPREGDGNDVVIVSFVSGVASVKSRVLLGIVNQMLKSVAYTQLRTNMQLGYVVNAGLAKISNVLLLSCVVQGDAMGADEMEAAVENVLTGLMPAKLNNLSNADFEQYRSSFMEEILQPPTDYSDEFNNFWSPVSEGGQCFDLRRNMLHLIKGDSVSKEALAAAYTDVVLPKDGKRQKLTVKYFAKKVPSRPSAMEAAKFWKKHTVPKEAVDILQHEFDETEVVLKADAATRKDLAKRGGLFDTDLGCELNEDPVEAPSLLQTRRKKGSRAAFLQPED